MAAWSLEDPGRLMIFDLSEPRSPISRARGGAGHRRRLVGASPRFLLRNWYSHASPDSADHLVLPRCRVAAPRCTARWRRDGVSRLRFGGQFRLCVLCEFCGRTSFWTVHAESVPGERSTQNAQRSQRLRGRPIGYEPCRHTCDAVGLPRRPTGPARRIADERSGSIKRSFVLRSDVPPGRVAAPRRASLRAQRALRWGPQRGSRAGDPG